MTTTANEKVKISLSSERPVLVLKKNWPLVAEAGDDRNCNNQKPSRRYYLGVRLHAVPTEDEDQGISYYRDSLATPTDLLAIHPDQRAIVYGWMHSSWQGESGEESGYQCTLDECPEVIRRVGNEIGADNALIGVCIADLPPVEETEETAVDASIADAGNQTTK